jgi:hypothetical protein
LVPPSDHIPRDDRPLPARPKVRDPSLANEILEMTFGYQLWQVFDTPRLTRKLVGRPYQARNVDGFDEVPDNSWFTNRNGRRPLSIDEIRTGANVTGSPAAGRWRVVSVKSEGVTPGMTIVDGRGRRYIIKFDPPDFRELSSGTECVASRLLHACGYNVPENYIIQLDPDLLELDPAAVLKVATEDKRDPIEERAMTQADLMAILDRVNPGRGSVRALASLFLPGVPVGPWRYTGVRRDDPNDLFPHEHRREIRGLYVMASWINHADMKEENTLDAYDSDARILQHYLIDFGAAMGSNSTQPSNPRRGQANSFDLKDSLMRLATLGLYVHDYEKAPATVRFPSVGYLETGLFKPDKWKPMYPVPAFENLTARDAFWGAKIVTSFSDEQIAAAVSAGEFSDPGAAAYMERFLIERRDMIGHYWFSRVNTIDRVTAHGDSLLFADLAVERGYQRSGVSQYRYRIMAETGEVLDEDVTQFPRVILDNGWKQHRFLVISLLPRKPDYRADPVLVFVRPTDSGWNPIGIRRLD